MKIEFVCTKENEDGSMDVTLDYDQEGLQVLLQTALNKILMDYIQQQADESQPKPNKTKKHSVRTRT